jgi:hypothetical protein
MSAPVNRWVALGDPGDPGDPEEVRAPPSACAAFGVAAGPPRPGCFLAAAVGAAVALAGCVGGGGEPTAPPARQLVIVTPAPTRPATPPPLVNQTYVVQEGDTLSGVAAMFGTSEDAIVAANGLGNRDQLFAGQSIVVPVPAR